MIPDMNTTKELIKQNELQMEVLEKEIQSYATNAKETLETL